MGEIRLEFRFSGDGPSFNGSTSSGKTRLLDSGADSSLSGGKAYGHDCGGSVRDDIGSGGGGRIGVDDASTMSASSVRWTGPPNLHQTGPNLSRGPQAERTARPDSTTPPRGPPPGLARATRRHMLRPPQPRGAAILGRPPPRPPPICAEATPHRRVVPTPYRTDVTLATRWKYTSTTHWYYEGTVLVFWGPLQPMASPPPMGSPELATSQHHMRPICSPPREAGPRAARAEST